MKIAVIGTVGLPARYGGFETLVENLVDDHHVKSGQFSIEVYCSSPMYPASERRSHYKGVKLLYLPLRANGAQSVAYDFLSLIMAVVRGVDGILLLGVSGAIALPFVRAFSSAHVVVNIDGLEWRRDKWGKFAKFFLKFSEGLSVKFSDVVVSDNEAIARYVKSEYSLASKVIAYGGEHAVNAHVGDISDLKLPSGYCFSVCRIEPENNIHMILEAFSALNDLSLVLVGNWRNSEYGRVLYERYAHVDNIFLFDPIYDPSRLKALRSAAKIYVHGHSAGGTNPSLVEAMHFSLPVFAYDCEYNVATTEGQAFYFSDSNQLVDLMSNVSTDLMVASGAKMKEIACRRYTWEIVSDEYFKLFKI